MAAPKTSEDNPRGDRAFTFYFLTAEEKARARAWSKAADKEMGPAIRDFLRKQVAAWEKLHGGLTLPPPAG